MFRCPPENDKPGARPVLARRTALG